jgi:hypothetical protein
MQAQNDAGDDVEG